MKDDDKKDKSKDKKDKSKNQKDEEKKVISLDEEIEAIRQQGQIAKLNIYKDFISRIASGEKLTPTELKTFHKMEREIEEIASAENGNGGKSKGELISSFNKAAEYCGVSGRNISYHVKKGNIRQNPDGTFERSELDNYLRRYGHKGIPGSGSLSRTEQKKEKAELRFREARARREEMLVSQLKDSLMSRKEVADEWAKRTRSITMAMDNLVDRLSPMLEGKPRNEIRSILKNEFKILRESYATVGKYCPEQEI